MPVFPPWVIRHFSAKPTPEAWWKVSQETKIYFSSEVKVFTILTPETRKEDLSRQFYVHDKKLQVYYYKIKSQSLFS